MKKTILIAILLSGCSTVKIRDYIFWGDKGIHGATGVHSLCPLDKCPPVLLNKPDWDAKRLGMVCTDAVVMAEIQANVDKLCAKNPKSCDYEKIATTRRSVRYMLRTQQWAGARFSPKTLAAFEPERDVELFEASFLEQ